MYAEGPRLVITGGNDAAPSRVAADRKRAAPVARVVSTFNRSVETVAVDMNNLSIHFFRLISCGLLLLNYCVNRA